MRLTKLVRSFGMNSGVWRTFHHANLLLGIPCPANVPLP